MDRVHCKNHVDIKNKFKRKSASISQQLTMVHCQLWTEMCPYDCQEGISVTQGIASMILSNIKVT